MLIAMFIVGIKINIFMSLLDVLTKNTRRTRQECQENHKWKEPNRFLLTTSVGEKANEEQRREKKKRTTRWRGVKTRLDQDLRA